MKGFTATTAQGTAIRFLYYLDEAPVTSNAFASLLPFTASFMHARVSGQEIWIDNATPLHIIQENASVFTEAGEVVYGPATPGRIRTVNCMGIYYGEGKGLDAANIFARVYEEDKNLLTALGTDIWLKGTQELTFTAID
jgi:hypothetical protein